MAAGCRRRVVVKTGFLAGEHSRGRCFLREQRLFYGIAAGGSSLLCPAFALNLDRKPMQNRLIAPLRQFLYSALTLLVCLYMSWHALLSVDFFYGFWHDNVGIAENIAEMGPQNRYRQGFEDTERAERLAVFGEICRAISNGGEGLADIHYTGPSGQPVPLLHRAEIIHLQDVANLVTTTQTLKPWVVALWLGVVVLFLYRRWAFPGYRRLLLLYSGAIAIAVVAVLSVGWVEIFYAAHRWVFPDDHQWFFYYQDSLMSTMMKAPDLFLYIGVTLLLLALLLFVLMHQALMTASRRRNTCAPPR